MGRWLIGGAFWCVLMQICAGCAANRGRMRVSPETFTASLARIERLEASIGDIEASIGDIAVGGGGDSVVSWILAGGLVLSLPGGGLFYQHVLRPLRIRKNGGARRRMSDE